MALGACASLVLLACLALGARAQSAFDISIYQQTESKSFYSCAVGQGIKYFIIQAVDSGKYNHALVANINNAVSAGFSYVDLYAFLCVGCQGGASGQQQATNTVQFISSQGLQTNQYNLWVDIESCSGCWSDANTNANFMYDLINELQNQGVSVGVYTSASQWSQIMGSWDGLSSFPLWYPHYDHNPSFSDFRPFAGWTQPTMKQYAGDTSFCGASDVDLDYIPQAHLEVLRARNATRPLSRPRPLPLK